MLSFNEFLHLEIIF